MEDLIPNHEVRRNLDITDRPKSTIDLDYLYSIKKQVQAFAEDNDSQLKKNVYKNYSLFIESSREISTLKEEMRQLNLLLDQQKSSLNELLEHLNTNPIIQPTIDRPKADSFRLELNEDTSEVEAEILPNWFTKSPEDFDVLIAQRNLHEAVELANRVEEHLQQYPKCCENNHKDLKVKLETRKKELINAICSELQPATDRSVQGGPRSSIASIRLLRNLNLTPKAVKLYLGHRSSILRFVLNQQRVESATTLEFIKQLTSIFYHHIVETCNEYKQAFDSINYVNKAVDESVDKLAISIDRDEPLLFNQISSIYLKKHPAVEIGSSTAITNGNGLRAHDVDKIVTNSLVSANRPRDIFYNLATYSSLISWMVQEVENFTRNYFEEHVFKKHQLSTSIIAESVSDLKKRLIGMSKECGIDMSKFVYRLLNRRIVEIVESTGNKLLDTVKELDAKEQWCPQQFQNQAQLTRFYEEMNSIGLDTMKKYMIDDHVTLRLHFTESKTSFARHFLVTVNDLAKLVCPLNKNHVDRILAKVLELEMRHVLEALNQAKVNSHARFVLGNSNFILGKVIEVADTKYYGITKTKCQELIDCRDKFQLKVKEICSKRSLNTR